jgi:Flp pilus assembly protein TadD
VRKIVFIGNCQIHSILNLYRQFASRSDDEKLHYVRSYQSIGPEDRLSIEQADVIVEQVQDFQPKADVAGIPTKGKKIWVPVVHCGFLWPFAGQPHPANPVVALLESGPYGAEMGDAFLNRLIRKGADVEDAVREYLELDINKSVNLDRLHEIVMEKQEVRDGMTEFRIAKVISGFYKTEQVFLTPYHPNLRVAMELAEQAFQQLGVPAPEISHMRLAVRITPFPKEELPVHPVVGKHFGLKWATDDRRYRFLSEGYFTFPEFARRYMTCEWNPALEEGLNQVRRREFQAARATLEAALRKSPESAPGLGALATVYEHFNESSKALGALRAAIEIDPDSASYHSQRAILLNHDGDEFGAEREYRLAAALEPFDPHYPRLLANYLNSKGRHTEAKAVGACGITCTPRAPLLYSEIAYAASQLGDTNAAEVAYLRAIELAPNSIEPSLALAEIYQTDGRLKDAEVLLRAAAQREPANSKACSQLARLLEDTGAKEEAAVIWSEIAARNPTDRHKHKQLIHSFLQAGQIESAVAAAQQALAAFPCDADFIGDLAIGLERLGRIDDALLFASEGANRHSTNARLCILRGDLLHRKGDLFEAEEAYRHSLKLAPNNAHVLGQLGGVLDREKRHEEAIAAREAACAIDPTNLHRRVQLGHVLMSAGRLDAAEQAIRLAITCAPDVMAFHLDLGHVLERSGRSAEAIKEVERAIELDPGDARAHAFLGHLFFNSQMWEKSEAEYRKAIMADSNEIHWRVQLVRLLAEQNRIAEAKATAMTALQLEPTNEILGRYSRLVVHDQAVGR